MDIRGWRNRREVDSKIRVIGIGCDLGVNRGKGSMALKS